MSVGNVEKNMLDIIWWDGEICVGLGGKFRISTQIWNEDERSLIKISYWEEINEQINLKIVLWSSN
jgi:hypothetical protein